MGILGNDDKKDEGAGTPPPENDGQNRDQVDEANAELEGSVEDAPETTRDDALDAGVPMLQGDPSEPQGPEDALGEGDKRGDYRDRQPEGTVHYESVPNPNAGAPVMGEDADGNEVQVDVEPHSILVPQGERPEQIGEVAGEKGGVTTGS